MSIEVHKISKTFGSFAALSDVSLNVPDGELVALLGPSGSGKTTLLRIIAGLEQPDENEGSAVLFNGQNVLSSGVRDRQVGFVFQHYALFRNMNVFDNIAFGLKVRPRKTRPSREQIDRKVRELLHLVQMEGLERRHPSQLSGGQRQRVALARALAVEPKVLLLDEPFGALDARVRQELRRWLRRLHDEIHVTSVFVTHDQEEALEVADRIVVMNQGKIEQAGTPDEVFHRPANEFVMQFLGSVNLFRGRIEQGRGVFGSLVMEDLRWSGGARSGHSGAHAVSSAAPDGRAARLLVRPHQMEISLLPSGQTAMAAVVQRVRSAGPIVRVELAGETGESIHAEITHQCYRELGISPHQRVFVSVREAEVFVDDYSI